MVTSGIRLGAPAATSRGFGVAEFKKVGELIAETLDGSRAMARLAMARSKPRSRPTVLELTGRFPIY